MYRIWVDGSAGTVIATKFMAGSSGSLEETADVGTSESTGTICSSRLKFLKPRRKLDSFANKLEGIDNEDQWTILAIHLQLEYLEVRRLEDLIKKHSVHQRLE